jgi:Zn-finger protein
MEQYKFFQNSKCEYFPCHKGNVEEFNCIFCYCPLYALKDKCGGNFKYLENGVKSCNECNIPHSKSGYEFIQKKIDMIVEFGMKENKE